IVGMACRFPGGVHDPESYWEMLLAGTDAISEVPANRFDIDRFYDPDPQAPGKTYSRWGGFLGPVDAFDRQFFGIAPREARSLDPQQRLLLECAWEAPERAGQPPTGQRNTKTGVFVGISSRDYADMMWNVPDPALIDRQPRLTLERPVGAEHRRAAGGDPRRAVRRRRLAGRSRIRRAPRHRHATRRSDRGGGARGGPRSRAIAGRAGGHRVGQEQL